MQAVKIVGLRKAVGYYNSFWKEKNWALRNGLMLHYNGRASIMFDKETGSMWTDVYENAGDWTDYSHYPEIICVSGMMRDYNYRCPEGNEYPFTMKGVKAFINEQVFGNKKDGVSEDGKPDDDE